jgi:hypothetical protein
VREKNAWEIHMFDVRLRKKGTTNNDFVVHVLRRAPLRKLTAKHLFVVRPK